jgi:hypothetical protein
MEMAEALLMRVLHATGASRPASVSGREGASLAASVPASVWVETPGLLLLHAGTRRRMEKRRGRRFMGAFHSG